MKKYYCSFWGDDAGESTIFHDIIEAKDIKNAINKLIKKWGMDSSLEIMKALMNVSGSQNSCKIIRMMIF